MAKTLFITGGAGSIGGNFVHLKMQQGAERIINLDKLTYAGNPDTLAEFRDDPRHVSMIAHMEPLGDRDNGASAAWQGRVF